MKHLLYILCIWLLYAQPTLCASSSSDTTASTLVKPTGKNKITKKVIDASTFQALINSDEEWHTTDIEPSKKYSLTIGNMIVMLQNAADIAIEATVTDYNTRGAKIKRREQLSPLLFTLRDSSRHQAAIAIARKLPQFINKTDSKGNTAFHYYCASNPTNLSDFPQMFELFKHQLHIRNKHGLAPIHMACDVGMLISLYAAGAHLDEQTVDMCSPYWKKNDSILGALHAMGFNSAVLATKFKLDASDIEKAAHDLKQNPQSDLYMLLRTIPTKDYKRTVAIAEKRPRLIEVTDINGNTPLHYLADQNVMPAESDSFFPYKLKRFFGHQLNICNNTGYTPIYCTSNPHVFITLYAMGGHIDQPTIAHLRPINWRNLPILAILKHIGFSSDFLATTFLQNKLEIEEKHRNLKKTINLVMHNVSLQLSKITLGSGSIDQRLTLREQYGRATKNTAFMRTQLAQSAKRSQRTDDEPTDTTKHARTS